jgi:hypothetical protein
MMGFTKILQSQARAIYLVFALVAVAGLLAYLNLPSDVYPELSFPRIAVIAARRSSGPGLSSALGAFENDSGLYGTIDRVSARDGHAVCPAAIANPHR